MEPPVVHALGMNTHGIRQTVERWRLPAASSLHIYTYAATLLVDGAIQAIRPGTVSLVPPGALMEYHFDGPSLHLYAHLSFSDRAEFTRPVSWHLGAAAGAVLDRLRGVFDAPDAHRAATVWSVLWEITSLRRDTARDEHPVVAATVDYIDAHLWSDLSVRALAARSRYSASHLARLFVEHRGVSVAAFVRDRRMATAKHLLERTTQPVASIAASVGFSDVQSFNKACRRYLGAPPRAVRRGSVAGAAGAWGTSVGVGVSALRPTGSR